MNPFSNPLIRNRTFPNVQFFSGKSAKDLHVPITQSYEEQRDALRNLHVPQQSFVPEDPLAGFSLHDDPTLAPDEWSKFRWINRGSSKEREWGDAWGRDEIEREKRENLISKKYNDFIAHKNTELKAKLEKDDFRKQLLKDLEDGKILQKTRLIDEN